MSPRLALVLLAVVASDASAQEDRAQLGTLFQTPQERATLDRSRRGEPVSEAAGLRANPVITGYVKRSDGKSTVFIDNLPFDVKGAKAEAHLQPRNVRSYAAPRPAAAPDDGEPPKAAGDPTAAAAGPAKPANKAATTR